MTILEASNKLLVYFAKNNSFNLQKDFLNLVTITDEPERDKAAVLCALNELEKLDILRRSDLDGEFYFVLIKPFGQFNQNINISGKTAETISTIVNSYCEGIGDKEHICDRKNITEIDLNNLITICLQITEANKAAQESQKPARKK